MVGQHRPKGLFRPATVAWKTKVIARMDELHMSRANFAREVKCSGAAVTQLLGKIGEPLRESSTKLKPDVHRVLGWPPPTDDEPREAVAPPKKSAKEQLRIKIDELDDERAEELDALLDEAMRVGGLPALTAYLATIKKT